MKKVTLIFNGIEFNSLVVISILTIFALFGLYGCSGNETAVSEQSSFKVQETHFKYIKDANIQYRTFTVERIDTVEIMKFVYDNTQEFLTVDFFIFNTPVNSPIWLDKFNTTDEINTAIYQSCPELIILASQGDPYDIPCDWFKPY
jgi:hypothetical protein